MPRTKVYDREDVLRKAVDVFWRKGYRACSVSDLVESTGLNTASMYKEFGDKGGLFVESLEYYRQHILAAIDDLNSESGSISEMGLDHLGFPSGDQANLGNACGFQSSDDVFQDRFSFHREHGFWKFLG